MCWREPPAVGAPPPPRAGREGAKRQRQPPVHGAARPPGNRCAARRRAALSGSERRLHVGHVHTREHAHGTKPTVRSPLLPPGASARAADTGSGAGPARPSRCRRTRLLRCRAGLEPRSCHRPCGQREVSGDGSVPAAVSRARGARGRRTRTEPQSCKATPSLRGPNRGLPPPLLDKRFSLTGQVCEQSFLFFLAVKSTVS